MKTILKFNLQVFSIIEAAVGGYIESHDIEPESQAPILDLFTSVYSAVESGTDMELEEPDIDRINFALASEGYAIQLALPE